MAITYEMDNWLSQQGTYENHCFISWPHINKNPDIAECARAVRDAIEEGLATSFHDPKVFMDTQIAGGADWEINIRRALCRSVSMVAICVPMYYRPEHLVVWVGMGCHGAIEFDPSSGQGFQDDYPSDGAPERLVAESGIENSVH